MSSLPLPLPSSPLPLFIPLPLTPPLNPLPLTLIDILTLLLLPLILLEFTRMMAVLDPLLDIVFDMGAWRRLPGWAVDAGAAWCACWCLARRGEWCACVDVLVGGVDVVGEGWGKRA
ncbi:uncharacterized protein K452DRAFT_309799 [Aplosporella prunicola CBS 121167]|uniref:Uncharacterized protein n=1 Tax=Aplosporella prunicola CBS 121167 TaxID=1176127 RepID=A0A6A6BBE5_9PEZI|nr:uncharacterized protein K452DRAFT_309799 [Aplosporella prunicola CBS 121167]KAF2140683.1 hypothetical protein K452DRAFT_309799 [Aplosporella prunicola CBS 121167]